MWARTVSSRIPSFNDVYIGDNTHIENCIVESRDTLKANTYFSGGDGIKVVYEQNERYVI